jgi:predicted RNA-binding Zn-ribbon protein involved in translation (DUF1610 family)
MAVIINLAEVQTAYSCTGCEDVIAEPVPLYECGECGTIFSRDGSADGSSHRCPDCNKFAAKLTEHGCPDCEEECEEVKAVNVDDEWYMIEGLPT